MTTESKEMGILRALFARLQDIVRFDMLYIVLFDKKTLRYEFPLAIEHTAGGMTPIEKPSTANLDHPLLKQVFSTGDVLQIADVAQYCDARRIENCPEKVGARSWLGAPLKVRGKAIGAVVVEDRAQENVYHERLSQIVATMAERAASALANARLVENLRTIDQVGQRLTSGIRLEEQAVVELIFEQVGELMNTDNMFVALYDADRRRLSFPLLTYAGKRESVSPRTIDPDDETEGGLTEIVIRTKQPLYIPNVEVWCDENNRTLPLLPLPKSWLGVPVLLAEKVLGVISLHNDGFVDLYDQGDQEVLQAMANQAAIAIDNARLYNYAQRRLAVLLEVGQALNSNIRLEQQEILGLIYEQTKRLMDTRNMYIALYDNEESMLSFPLSKEGGADDPVKPRKIDIKNESAGGLTEIVIRNHESLYIPDVASWCVDNVRTLPEKPDPKSWLGVPMLLEGKVLGVISLRNYELENAYTQEDIAVLEAMAGQAAVALENARLYEQTHRNSEQFEQLYAIGLQLGSLREVEKVLFLVAENVCELVKADVATIFPYDVERGEFNKGIRAGTFKESLISPTAHGLAAELVRESEQVFKSQHEMTAAEKVRFDSKNVVLSYAGIPLIFEGKCIGLLFVDYFHNHLFSKEEKRLIQLLGTQAAIALNNARQYEMSQRLIRAERWAELGQLASSLAHRIGNKGGLIRLRANELLDYQAANLPNDHFVKNSVDAIMYNNQYMLDLSNLLFKPLRASSARMAPSDITLLVKGALKNAEIPYDVEININDLVQVPLVKVNRFFVEVFLEIIANAVDAMRSSSKKVLKINTDYDENWVWVSFSDTGLGIMDDQRDKIFELMSPSGKEDPNKHHFGFGLWWVRTFLHDIGGDIKVESRSGVGATFTVRLPREDER